MKQPNSASQVEFRLYYAADGSVITYSVEKLAGNYIIITKEQYAEARPDVVVVDGKLVYTHTNRQIWKYTKVATGGTKTHKFDICILDDNGAKNWEFAPVNIC